MSVKEPASQGSAKLVEEEVQQKLVPTTDGGNVECVYNYAFFVDFLLRALSFNLLSLQKRRRKRRTSICLQMVNILFFSSSALHSAGTFSEPGQYIGF